MSILVFFCGYGIILFTLFNVNKEYTGMEKGDKEIDWLMVIPIIFWIFCMCLSVGKMLQTGNKIHIIDWVDIFNSNTFSTYISLIICMAYQYFSIYDKKQQEKSGLSRKWISLTIISTIVYGVIAIVNACRYCLLTAIIMAIASIIYVILFFKFMKIKK